MPELRRVTDPDIVARVRAAAGLAAPAGRKQVTDPAIVERVRAAAGLSPRTRIDQGFEAAADQPEADLMSRGQSALEGMAQGMTLGFGDEIGAALDLGFEDIGNLSDAYRENLNRRRAALKVARGEHPVVSVVGEVGGAVATAPFTPAFRAAQGAGVVGRGITNMATGGAYGLGYGFGSGEGGLGDRLLSAGEGGAYGVLGGAVASPIIDAVAAGGRAVGRSARELVAPFTASGRERLAARTMDEAATDPSAVRQSLAGGTDELVPGSMPTTFQQTGDMGLGGLERSVAARNPVEFMARRGEQNAARVGALEGMQPGGFPEAVPQVLKRQLAAIDETTQREINDLSRAAQERSQRLGGTGTPEGYGEALRSRLAASERAARDQEQALWKAVDPDGTLALRSDSVRQAAADIQRNLPRTARPIEGEEAGIFAAAEALPSVARFSDIAALRSRLSTAMREELFARGQSPVYARLSQLRSAVERDLEGAVSRRVAEEAEAVAAGAMRQEDTMAAAIERLRRDQQDWYDRRATAEGVGQSVGRSAGANVSIGPGRIRAAPRTEIPSGSGPRNAPRDSRLQEAEFVPNFGEAAQGRLKAATAATRERAGTFNRGTTGALLKRSGQSGPYNVPTSVVPERIFAPGAKGADSVAAYRRAVGDDEAMRILRDYAASKLRRVAERPDGTLDPRKVDLWRRQHADALRAFPELDRQMADAAVASTMLAEAGAVRKAALDNFQIGTIGRLVDAADREDTVRRIGAIFGRQDSMTLMRRLVAELGGDAQAREGLRKSVVEHISNSFVGNTEAATTGIGTVKSDAFQSFIRQNRGPLALVFKGEELKMLTAIAEDLQRANRSIASVKLPGGSNTVQDALVVGKGGPSILGRILTHVSAGSAGYGLGGPLGGIAGVVGLRAVTAMRQAGLEKVDDLVKAAMLDPVVAKALLAKAPLKRDKGPAAALASRFRKLSGMLPAIWAVGQDDRVSGP